MSDPSTNNYVFRSPFASSIYPILTPDKTLSLLHELNASRPPEKRLPVEILLYVNKELHTTNPVLEDIRATWTPLTAYEKSNHRVFYMDPPPVAFNKDARRYYILEKPSSQLWWETFYSWCGMLDPGGQVSPADLLYRLRCYFPEIGVRSCFERLIFIWRGLIMHNQSGLFLQLTGTDMDCARFGIVGHSGSGLFCETRDPDKKTALLNGLYADLARLLNALFFEAADWNHRQFAYYHPAAHADFPANDSDEHYIAVSTKPFQRRDFCDHEVDCKWRFEENSATDLSSFPSLLQELKYDVTLRKVDRLNGTANLTTVISSALLLYRLQREFRPQGEYETSRPSYLPGGKCCRDSSRGWTAGYGNVNEVPPIHSVWQFELAHKETKTSVIFLDDRGLFDIRANEGIKEVMDDVEALVESLLQ